MHKLDQPADLDPLLERIGGKSKLLVFPDSDIPAVKMGQRAIGVVYDPAYERYGNYVDTVLPSRYDAFIHVGETNALHPLHMPVSRDEELPETFPTGLQYYLTPVGALFSLCSNFMCSSLS
jgi:erythromycin esterase